MKKTIIILAAVACALCACQKHEIELLDKPIIEQIDGNTYTYTFSAVISDNVSEVEEDGTKATVSRAGAFAWAVDDELKFFKSDNTSANAKITAVDGSTATITVYDVDSRADFVTAIYPASAAVAKNQISFNARGPIVVADIADGGTLTFHHIGSLINLKFYEISALTEIKSLVFEPATPFTYDGSFTFDGSHVPSLTPTGSTEKIVVPASSARNNEDITVVVPSVILSGFSAALNDKADGTGRNLFKKSTVTAHDLAASRPVLMNMKRVAYAAPTKFYVTNVSPSHYWDRSNVRMIQSEASKYETWMNCDGDSDVYVYDEYNVGNHLSGYLNKGHVGDGNLYQIYYNTSTKEGGPVYKGSTADKPFYNASFPTDDFCVMGTFDGWNTDHKFTYNGNLNWVYEGLEITSDNTYGFGVRKASADQYWAGANTLTGLYGNLKGTGEAKVTLQVGTYNVYVCPTEDWNYLIMFEKQ